MPMDEPVVNGEDEPVAEARVTTAPATAPSNKDRPVPLLDRPLPTEYEELPGPHSSEYQPTGRFRRRPVPASLLRNLPEPYPDDLSTRARCIRFARSHSQRSINWRDQQSHLDNFVGRTNGYGLELLRSREDRGGTNRLSIAV
ncbi:hypothetical protein K469DRAFT_770056 [Zopfia rhizophila CBS 207.26]|uniref:Uncharacterized protein n=1 Tax=Zopfia rhizophila CBS 207.26 TaxID=1314779 RepID=A0A6A6EAD4_9PEZI|nr:hypothetical protein K469DRAFT_770056 [Zopfia rhizophila CBS 207.26]